MDETDNHGGEKLGLLNRLFRRTSRLLDCISIEHEILTIRLPRPYCFEQMEPRQMLSAEPVVFGAVYIEQDIGSDEHGDTFEVTFVGGAVGTELTRLVIHGDQDDPGFGVGDVFFDILDSNLGADQAFPFTLVSHVGIDRVRWDVRDGESTLVLEFEGFHASEKLIFTIDVDEVEEFDPSEPNEFVVNEGFDPITSGVEFQGSQLTGHFSATHYHDASHTVEFRNRYDDLLAGTDLPLSPDDVDGQRDRTAAAIGQLVQQPMPIAISGTVYEEIDLDLVQDDGELGIADVTMSLWKKDGDTYLDTGYATRTDAHGDYQFGRQLGLTPGVYEIRQNQPDSYFSVGATPGKVNGSSTGHSPAGDPNRLTEITIPLGDLEAIENDFAEARAAEISGYVYHDKSNDSLRDAREPGIAGVDIEVIAVDTLAPQRPVRGRTDAAGFYQVDGLAPGTYRIVQPVQPADFFDGQDRAGLVGGRRSGRAVNPGDQIEGVFLGGGQSGFEYNFGELQPVSIQGTVHLSDPTSGCFAKGASHAPVAGAVVLLQDEQGNVLQEVTSDTQGNYEFMGLRPGVYTIVELTPINLFDGAAHAGTVEEDMTGEVVGPGMISGIRLSSGQHAIDYDFCEHPPASLSGVVYHDRDNDGFRSPQEEEVIPGVELELLDAVNQQVLQTQVTDDQGNYRFNGLPAGAYIVQEAQPHGWLDGLDRAGTVNGVTVGKATNPGDEIRQIQLRWGEAGQEYNFGEQLFGSIAGMVHTDIVRDCRFSPDDGERGLAGVRLELLDSEGRVVQTSETDEAGRYRFEDVRPGEYSVREQQPAGMFHGGQRASDHGADDSIDDLITGIVVGSDQHLVDYNFCEEPPATISGFVFQDGPPVLLLPGQEIPDHIQDVRDGRLTADDMRLPGVVLQLRDGITGQFFTAARTLPGHYSEWPIETTTDVNGFYEFSGLARGNYAVYQLQPEGFIDGVDTAGTRFGIAFNPGTPVSPSILNQLQVDPHNDAIVRIGMPPGSIATNYNFSEVQIGRIEFPPPAPPSTPLPPPIPQPPILRDFVSGRELPPPPLQAIKSIESYGGSGVAYTWHLSVIDGGRPRGQGVAVDSPMTVWLTGSRPLPPASEEERLRRGLWIIEGSGNERPREQWLAHQFGLPGAIPVAGDFNGDGAAEIGIFYRGQWFIDINANGVWDVDDLWVRLGNDTDIPVTGDWDGDGKDDIGVFGPAWKGDRRAIQKEPGLPDKQNQPDGQPKNVPPKPEDATSGRRLMQLTSSGRTRADLIDHVFHYGVLGDVPTVGDWNGDGIKSIGIFRSGRWHLDVDGDGRWSAADMEADFGERGDIPIVGDFNGDGVDEIGIYRAGVFYLDINGNRKLDARDRVFELGDRNDKPVVGDWDGDGTDEVAVYRERGTGKGVQANSGDAKGESHGGDE